uniref:WS/DGAT domain-containing protein n=1 Tax=Solicola gregarius TaxID=2908642 RepID=UPI0023068DA0|nr:WS/DGAT domain-containing protein [Solicola gregarius]
MTAERALSIGVTSYDGAVFYGIVTDRDAIPDADVLAQCIEEALAELVESAASSHTRAPRGRARPKGRDRR